MHHSPAKSADWHGYYNSGHTTPSTPVKHTPQYEVAIFVASEEIKFDISPSVVPDLDRWLRTMTLFRTWSAAVADNAWTLLRQQSKIGVLI